MNDSRGLEDGVVARESRESRDIIRNERVAERVSVSEVPETEAEVLATKNTKGPRLRRSHHYAYRRAGDGNGAREIFVFFVAKTRVYWSSFRLTTHGDWKTEWLPAKHAKTRKTQK
jgi:hypothetical protein